MVWKKGWAGQKDDGSKTGQFYLELDDRKYYANLFSDDGGNMYYVRVDRQIGNIESPKFKEKSIFQRIVKGYDAAIKIQKEYIKNHPKGE